MALNLENANYTHIPFNRILDKIYGKTDASLDTKEDYLVEDSILEARFGYWILPNGDLLVLNEPMQHGLIAAVFDNRVLEILDEHLDDDLNTDKKKFTQCDIIACHNLGWLRISFSTFDGAFNFAWSRSIEATREQLQTLNVVCDFKDPSQLEDYWWEYGNGSFRDMLKALNTATKA